ncbi:MAG TPA: serine/threonine-protein kinase, partial [Gemmataceae bacterium]|nr:serine/threonine-protein kinase [Gemmataceae bacterium]
AAARRVSHPTVCRGYAIAEHGGQSFLTMEFVDGEDLSSVLKRLGRVPEEKGVEVARQLCSALAAVHDQGLLHRDLKPANVMLDGRGRVRLTDFGLAAAADDLSATDVRSGTPLYQAPEQLAGREVTVRSDLYALGLVLYELFTGRRAFPDAKRDATPGKPSSHVSTLDPAVEAVILKCLEADPANRPRSAAEVLARLPGGDPLAAAVAAGETPSPQLVADADPADGPIRPWVAAALVAAVVVGMVVNQWLSVKVHLSARTPLKDADPALMRYKAREVLAALGHTEPPADEAIRYITDPEYLMYVVERDPSSERWAGLADDRPPAVVVIYRAARAPLAATNWHNGDEQPGLVTPLSPPPIMPGMVGVTLDLRGRLVRFHKVADFLAPADAPARTPTPDWQAAFKAAGLDFAAFGATPARHRPPLAADARFAWEGSYPDRLVDRVRVEAASLGGVPVYFAVEFPWQAGDRAAAHPSYELPLPAAGRVFVEFLLPLLAAGLAAWNWRRGRADVRGAVVLGGVFFAVWVVRWVLTARHLADSREHLLAFTGLGFALYWSFTTAVFYLALEPFVRKRWPRRMVGWTRLLAGRVRDPLVCRDVLIGAAAGVVFNASVLLYYLGHIMLPFVDNHAHPARTLSVPILGGARVGLTYFFILFVALRVCRYPWLGVVVTIGVAQAAFYTPEDPLPVRTAFIVLVNGTGMILLALRYGLLTFVALFVGSFSLLVGGGVPAVGVWFATGPLMALGAMLLVTLYAAYHAAGGRRIFSDE